MSIAPVTGRAGFVGTPPLPAAATGEVPAPQLSAVRHNGAAGASTGMQQRVDMFDASSGTARRVDVSSLLNSTDPIAKTAFANGLKVDDFLRTAFQRDGWDGKGSPLPLVIHAPDPEDGDPRYNNAYWDADKGKIFLGDGDGRISDPLGNALDVLTHETIHAIVTSEVKLRYEGQQGALNESFADVLGSLNDDDWLIAEDVFTPGHAGDSLRDLANPRFASTREIPYGADVDEYDLSGIPSLAAVRVADKVGRADMGRIWYRALTEHLDSRSGFAGAARATLSAATDLFGASSKEFTAVAEAWKGVGVDARYRPKQTPVSDKA